METHGIFQYEIITNGLVSSLGFIWIPMLWVYDHYNMRGSTLDVRFWRLKSVPALEE